MSVSEPSEVLPVRRAYRSSCTTVPVDGLLWIMHSLGWKSFPSKVSCPFPKTMPPTLIVFGTREPLHS